MGRPKKLEQLDPILARKLAYYAWARNDKEKWFPDDPKLLHNIITALLSRLSRKNVSVARWVYHAIQRLSVAEKSWKSQSSIVSREMNSVEWGAFYGELLCEIAETNPSKRKKHWGPAFPMQRDILKEHLHCEGFPLRGAIEPRISWLVHNGRELEARLKNIPCPCNYAAEVSLDQFSEKDIKRAEPIGSIVRTVLARLHGIPKGSINKHAEWTKSDAITPWYPGLEYTLPMTLLEIESRINPSFPPFDFSQPKPNS